MHALFPQAMKQSSIPLLAFILAAEGWLVAATMARPPDEAGIVLPPAATAQAVSSEESRRHVKLNDAVSAFFKSAATEEERLWMRSIMQVYLQEYRGEYLSKLEKTAAPPFVKPVGAPTPQQELNALSRFIEDHGRRMLDAYRSGASPLEPWQEPGRRSDPLRVADPLSGAGIEETPAAARKALEVVA